jgi:tetratricopeptide (TPR) repeat protein
MVALTLMRDGALKKAEEDRLAQFEREKEASKEAAKTAGLYQSQFWDFVSRRNFDGAKAFVAKQRIGAAPEVDQALVSMDKVLDEIRAGFEIVARNLSGQAGKTVSLALLENGQQKNRSFMLKAVKDGKIVYLVEGRELTVPLSDLHSSEITKQAAASPKDDKDLLNGLARFLDGGFDEAHVHLTAAGARAQGLVAFVENSTVFLERNAPVMKERAARHVKDKEWERAIQEYTKLASIPSERKCYGRGHHQLNNFMGRLRIDALFEMDDFSEPTIDLLNQAFKRSALIDKAIRMYEKASARVPKNASILANLVALYMQIHDFQKAKDTLALRSKDLQGGGQQLSQLVHLVTVALEPAFPGKTYKAQYGRYDVETNVSQEYRRDGAVHGQVYQSYPRSSITRERDARFHLSSSPPRASSSLLQARRRGRQSRRRPLQPRSSAPHVTLTPGGSWADEVKFNPGRHNTVKWLYVQNQLPSLKEIFMMSGDVFRAKGALHYGSSWSVIYWFIKSGRKQVLDRYFEALMEGKDQQQAFDAIFGPGKENVDELDALWRRAIREENYDK